MAGSPPLPDPLPQGEREKNGALDPLPLREREGPVQTGYMGNRVDRRHG